MILADTNVILDFWDKPDDESARIFEDNEIAPVELQKQNCCAEAILKTVFPN